MEHHDKDSVELDSVQPQQHRHHIHQHNSSAFAIIDDSTIQDFISFNCHDSFNNYTFSVARRQGTTFINPVYNNNNNSSLVELKVGVLLPFHQNNNGWTRVMTMR